ncbi:ATP-binding cassette domain-containing protein [Niabella hirudinis]|uniref:ATP-binding cassette domain-containing protein n=1 Tax=Niabella hirudinis TaxID=1285929 RepID=UPI003EBC7754
METYCSIILNNVSVQQAGHLLLDHISFTLNAGEHLAIFGASGSGKSLLAQVLKGSLLHTGSIEYKRSGRPAAPFVAYIPSVHPLENYVAAVKSGATLTETLLHKGPAADVTNWLEKFQLTPRAHAPITRLSYGELKKMQLIDHLLGQPDILILDRIFTGLDVKSRTVLHKVINLLATEGVTIILIADRHELPASITHFAEMAGGTVINYAPVEKLGFMKSVLPREPETPLPSLKKAYHIGPLIGMKQVSIRSGNTLLLNNINWQVNNGECWLIKGHNGAGKSTLLRLINGDHPQAYAQQISLFGRKRGSGESVWDIKRRIGFISPELQHLFDRDISVFEVIGSGFFDTIGLFEKLDEAQALKVKEWLSFFSLQDKARHLMTTLSGGERRLVLLARALIKDPLMLALDGPCQGLDDSQSAMVVRLLERIHAETGMTLLFISHYEDEVPSCVKHIIELENGHPTLYKKIARPAFATSKKYTLTHRVL